MVSARTVNLGHIACERPGRVLIASTYRRLQRFFQHVELGADWARRWSRGARARGSWTLALDRTHWKIGKRDVNYLVLAVVTRRFRVPLLWSLLPGSGNSATETRIALIARYLARFPAATVRLLLADREFIGAEWLKFLDDNGIRFAIRLREDLRVVTEDGCELTLFARLHATRKTRFFSARLWHDGQAFGPLLNFAARRLKDEWLIVVSNRAARTALAAYRKRWAIECLFGDAKTRGLNLEDTRLTEPRKLDLLMALVTLAIAWAGRTARDLLGSGEPRRKTHGHLAKSWFRIGFDSIRNRLRTEPEDAIRSWLAIASGNSQTTCPTQPRVDPAPPAGSGGRRRSRAVSIQASAGTSRPIGPRRATRSAGASGARSARQRMPARSSAQTRPGPAPGSRSRSLGLAAGAGRSGRWKCRTAPGSGGRGGGGAGRSPVSARRKSSSAASASSSLPPLPASSGISTAPGAAAAAAPAGAAPRRRASRSARSSRWRWRSARRMARVWRGSGRVGLSVGSSAAMPGPL